jgi:hypothetical protein
VVIQLVLPIKDGMVNHVLILPVHLDLSTMELIVFVQILTVDVYLGNFSMDKNVFTSKILVLKELDGMEQCVFQLLVIVQLVIINLIINVNHSLKNAFLLLHGIMINVFLLLDHVLMEQLVDLIVVNLTVLVKVAKFGILIFYNAHVPRVLVGMAKNVLFVLEDKYGMLKMVALVLKDSLCLELDVKNLLLICVN